MRSAPASMKAQAASAVRMPPDALTLTWGGKTARISRTVSISAPFDAKPVEVFT